MFEGLELGPQPVDPSLARRHEVIRSRSLLGTGSTSNGRKKLIDARLEKKLEHRGRYGAIGEVQAKRVLRPRWVE